LIVASGQQGGEAVAADAVSLAERFDPERTPRAMSLMGVLANRKDPDCGLDDLVAAVDRARRIGSTSDIAYSLHCVGWALGLDGAAEEAENHFGQAVAICEAAEELWWRGVVQCRRSLIAWAQADRELMESTATEALRAARTVPDTLTCADAVSVLGAVQVGSDDSHAAYLFGAAERGWDDAGGSLVRMPPWKSLLAEAKAQCQAAMGAAAFEARHKRGREDGLQKAITTALGERTPARSPRPGILQFGLTRREREIVRLVSEGLTNREIADRLVISTRTAETHVQNILTKTGFSTRSKVAAWHASHHDQG
jgi:non-specific serine/threonine protein kinase